MRAGTGARRSAPVLVAALAVAALAVALLAGCGSLVPAPAGLTSQPTGNGVVGYFIPATMAQVDSGTTFQQMLTTLEKEQFESCVRRLGFSPAVQAFAFANLNLMPFSVASGFQRAQEAALGLVNLSSVNQPGGMLAPIYIPVRPNMAGVTPAEMQAVQADQWRCWSRARQAASRLNLLGAALSRQWSAVEARVEASAPVRAADKVFGKCVLREGAPAAAAGSLRQFIGWLEGVINRGAVMIYRNSGGGIAAVSRSPATAALGKTDAQWTAVFARCAGPVVGMMQGLLLVQQQAFLQTHFQQVAELEKVAAQTTATLVRTSQQQ